MADPVGERPAPTLSRVKTPLRPRRQRSIVSSGITWLPPEQVPGAVLPASVERAQREHIEHWRRHHAQAPISGASYVIT